MKKKFKYNINHYISLLPRHIQVQDVEGELATSYSIPKTTFYNDRSIPQGSSKSIPSDRMDAYAIVLGVEAYQLKNYVVEGKSILDIKASPKEISKLTGLEK